MGLLAFQPRITGVAGYGALGHVIPLDIFQLTLELHRV